MSSHKVIIKRIQLQEDLMGIWANYIKLLWLSIIPEAEFKGVSNQRRKPLRKKPWPFERMLPISTALWMPFREQHGLQGILRKLRKLSLHLCPEKPVNRLWAQKVGSFEWKTSENVNAWRFSLMEISHSCRCLPISCLNRWILSANLLELLEPLLFWPFLFCGVCVRCGTLETSSEQCKPKKKRQKLPAKLPQISAKLTQIPAKTRKNPQIRKRRFLDFLNAMKTWSSLPFMCEMVLKPLKWHEMTWKSWNYWNYWKAKTTGNFLEDESPGGVNSC